MSQIEALAKIVWHDPHTKAECEFVLAEGATVTIGRSANNDIQIAERHVSRQHAVISYRKGVFMITDLGSSNGTFVNDERVEEPFPLFAGDTVRLYVPTLSFEAADIDDAYAAEETGFLITATLATGRSSLIVTNGPQEGQTIPLLLEKVVIGRATKNASWEILIQDPSVSRPHARLEKEDNRWYIHDLNSSNGTAVNNHPVSGQPQLLEDGDTLTLGGSILLFRSGWVSPSEKHTAASSLSEQW